MSYFDWLVTRIEQLRQERRRARHHRYNANDKGWARNARYEATQKARARKRLYETTVRPGSRSCKAPGAYQLATRYGMRWTNHLSVDERRAVTAALREGLL